MEPEAGPLIVFYGSKTKRKILHLSIRDRHGALVPRCACHHDANHDKHERAWREPVGPEESYPVCKRCQFQAGIIPRRGMYIDGTPV
jgi:hypothetical protein